MKYFITPKSRLETLLEEFSDYFDEEPVTERRPDLAEECARVMNNYPEKRWQSSTRTTTG